MFDDYDGYAYNRGSGHLGQYQSGSDYGSHDVGGDLGSLAKVVAKVLQGVGSDMKVDEALNWWFNDEYVHAPGQPWYRECSPSIERYSHFGEKGIYPDLAAESRARFPVAESTGHAGKGIPFSVFMPVDNLGRYWYDRYLAEPDCPSHLGMVMHAIQDASIPHHASGTMGNWHSRYEREVGERADEWLAAGRPKIRKLVLQWFHASIEIPTYLHPADWKIPPATNWPIDHLITWVALHAHAAYDEVYHGFRDGWNGVDDANGPHLCYMATAACAIALYKAVTRH